MEFLHYGEKKKEWEELEAQWARVWAGFPQEWSDLSSSRLLALRKIFGYSWQPKGLTNTPNLC